MEVKFKMPKMGGKVKSSGFWKELLLTFLATTISIVLTFGTAMWLEHRQKEKNRRQTAIMVISDLYDFNNKLQWYEDSVFNKWKADLEVLRTLSPDSIRRIPDEKMEDYWKALVTSYALLHDKTAETIFTSDISTWREVGNFSFIKQVGFCYSEIGDIEKNFKIKMDAKGENFRSFCINNDVDNMTDAELMIAFINTREEKVYIDDFCDSYCGYIQGQIDILDRQIKMLMESMGISQKDLEDFMYSGSFES